MMRKTRLQAALIALFLFAGSTSTARATVYGEGDGDSIDLTGIFKTYHPGVGNSPNPNIKYEPGPCEFSWTAMQSFSCWRLSIAEQGSCPDNWVRLPMYVYTRTDPTQPWSPRQLSSSGYCAAGPAEIIALITEDFRVIKLDPSEIKVGPPAGWLPVQMDNIVYTNTDPQITTTSLLGHTVLIKATPTQFIWDFGDNTPTLTTTDPGHPYPDQTLTHPYTQEGDYTVTLATTWTGEFSLDNGATYTPITGTATTVSTAAPINVTEYRTHLITDLY